MSKSADMFLDMTRLVETTDKKFIHALDIEGAPKDTNQISVVSGDEKSLFNTYCTGGRLSDGKKMALAVTLKRTKILVGFGVESDITALAKQDIDVSVNIVIVDLYYTMLALLEKGLINKNLLKKQDLQGVAEYYGIKNITGYHNSLVDATVTMKLFWAMYEKNHGYFWMMANHRSQGKMGSAQTESSTDQEEDMDTKNGFGVMDYSYEEPDVIYKSSGNLYEALIMIGRKEQIVRMTKSEYDLYQKICKFAPGYPLRVFYLTILAPGQMTAVRKFKEKLEEEKRALEGISEALENEEPPIEEPVSENDDETVEEATENPSEKAVSNE